MLEEALKFSDKMKAARRGKNHNIKSISNFEADKKEIQLTGTKMLISRLKKEVAKSIKNKE